MLTKSETKSVTLVENSLYHYVSTQNIPERNHSKGLREAIYIHLPKIENKKSCAADWKLTEQHLTIDRFINHTLPFLSSSHFTQTYGCLSQPKQHATVHIYFDRQGNIHNNLCIRIKDLETKVELHEGHTFHIDENLVMEQAKIGQQKVLAYIEQQRAYFKNLSQQCNAIDYNLALSNQQFFEALPKNKHAILVESIKLGQAYLKLLEQLVLHSNSPLEYSVYLSKKSYVCHLIDQLNQSLESVQPPKQTKKKIAKPLGAVDHSSFETLCPAACQQPLEALIPELSIEDVKTEASMAVTVESPLLTQQRMLSNHIDLLQVTSSTDNVVTYLTLLNSINEALLELELIYDKKMIKDFLHTQRARLPKINLHDFFLNLCKTGNIENISQAYPYVLCKIDMLSLFSQMHNLILREPSVTETLIQAADFFYENSTEYQAYILIEQVKFKTSTQMQGLFISSLIYSFVANNLPAFRMHLRQGRSIHLAHTYIDENAFNALQSVILCARLCVDMTSLHHYIDLLFQAGAKFETPKLPSQKASVTTTIESSQDLSQFVNLMKAKGKLDKDDKIATVELNKTKMKEFKASSAQSKIPTFISQYCESLQQFQNKKNILEAMIFIGLFNECSVSIFEHILAYADLKACLMAITNTFNNKAMFVRIMSTYNKADITFFKTSDALSDYIERCQDRINGSYKTFQFAYAAYPMLNHTPKINEEDLELKINGLIKRFNTLYQPLSHHEKRSFVQELKTDIIHANLSESSESNKLAILDALLISIASLPDATRSDFMLMISLTIKYYKMMTSLYFKDQIILQTQVLNEIFTKIANLMLSMEVAPAEASEKIREFSWLVDHIDPKLKILMEDRPACEYDMAVSESNQRVRDYEKAEEKKGKEKHYLTF